MCSIFDNCGNFISAKQRTLHNYSVIVNKYKCKNVTKYWQFSKLTFQFAYLHTVYQFLQQKLKEGWYVSIDDNSQFSNISPSNFISCYWVGLAYMLLDMELLQLQNFPPITVFSTAVPCHGLSCLFEMVTAGYVADPSLHRGPGAPRPAGSMTVCQTDSKTLLCC